MLQPSREERKCPWTELSIGATLFQQLLNDGRQKRGEAEICDGMRLLVMDPSYVEGAMKSVSVSGLPFNMFIARC